MTVYGTGKGATGCLDPSNLNSAFSTFRALFGDEKESITTLWAWQHMLQEARWFGRALYDAEELIMRQSRDFLTEV